MKTKNMRKKALLSSLAMLLVAVVALSSATYAWFTSSQEATISTVTVSVASSSGIQISPTGDSGWNTYLNVPATEIPTKFVPVSVFADELGTANFYKGTVGAGTGANAGQEVISFAQSSPTGTLVTAVNANNSKARVVDETTGDEISASNDYLVKHFFVKVGDAVTLKVSNLTISPVTGSTVDDIIKAARIGIAKHGSAVDKANLTGGESWGSATPAWVYEPAADEHIEGLGDSALTTYAVKAAPAANTLLSTVFNTEYKVGDTYYTKAVTVNQTANPAASTATYDNISLSKGITWLTLYVWIEGQDADCVNEISGGSFNVDIQFSIA